MLSYLSLGAAIGFAAAVQPGQFQAYLVSQTMAHGWRRTAPAALAPLVSDLPIVVLVLVVLVRVPPVALQSLQVAGGGYLLVLAARAARSVHAPRVESAGPRTSRRTILEAAAVNLLNPSPYLSWTMVLGPLVLRAWRESPGSGVGVVAGFYGAMIAVTTGLVLLLAGARALGPRVARLLVAGSAVALALFGAYQLWAGLSGLAGRP